MTDPRDPHRRQLLKAATAAAGLLGLAGCAGRARWDSDPFSLGVASGSPAADSVVLWTRLLPAHGGLPEGGRSPVAVRWEIAHDPAFARVVQRGETLALPQLAHSVHVEAQGLEPDRWYFYRFHAGDATSPVGRTRTLPAADAQPARLRLSYASCQRWEHGYYAAWRHMREEQLDLVMFLGDYIYEYPNATAAVRSFPTLGWVHTLAQYRERHALHRSDPDLQAMHAQCPWLLTWDDHEVQNDYAGATEATPIPGT
jgi:alkaline phosphatase D